MPMPQTGLAPLVAIIGCDGSGKSTVSKEILAWVRRYGPAESAHLGKQAGNVGRAIAQWPLVGAWAGRVIARKTDRTRKGLTEQTNPGLLPALVIMMFLLRRLLRFRRMLALRRRGLIVVTDRYPQLDIPGAFDSTDLLATGSGSPMVRWLARRELSAYTWMVGHRPDLILRLNVDLDTACARKPDHRREVLSYKVAATPLLKFNGAQIVEIDANRSLPEVLADAQAAVSRMMEARGYTTGSV